MNVRVLWARGASAWHDGALVRRAGWTARRMGEMGWCEGPSPSQAHDGPSMHAASAAKGKAQFQLGRIGSLIRPRAGEWQRFAREVST